MKQIAIALILMVFSSCTDTKKKNVSLGSSTLGKGYRIDLLNAKVKWFGFKTDDKIKVGGEFKVFRSDRADRSFPTIESLLNGMQFAINTYSSESGDPTRDENLRDYFFKLLTKTFSIEGEFGELQDGKIPVKFDILGSREIRLSVNITEKMITMKGSVDIVEDLAGREAFESIHQKCYSFHLGKTWQEVEVLVTIPLKF